MFVMDAGGAAAGQTRPSLATQPAGFTARLSGCQVTRAARRAAPRHTQSFLARGPCRLTHQGLVCGFNVCFINCLPERGDQGSKKTNGARFHANFKLISRKIKAVSPFNQFIILTKLMRRFVSFRFMFVFLLIVASITTLASV